MTTRSYKNNGIFNSSKSSEYSIPENFELPPCSIEDVDRSLFELFDKQLPFTYKRKQGTRRAPVIFATGERFAILRRRQPLRDKTGVLILPLISIMRTGISQIPTMGAGTAQNLPMTIKRRLTPEDQNYQRIVNKAGLKNSDDAAVGFRQEIKSSKNGPFSTGSVADPSRLMRVGFSPETVTNTTLNPDLGNNIFEVITMPPPKYYTATYEITFWAQYTSQMNDMIMSLMSLYQSYSQRTFKLETPKGYWFVAYAGETLNPDNNFDDFSDSERLVRYSFDITVPAYIVGNVVPGGQNVLRRTFSSPVLSFGIESVVKDPALPLVGIQSGDFKDYTLEDIRTASEPLPGQSIVANSDAKVDSRGPNENTSRQVESVGGKDSKST